MLTPSEQAVLAKLSVFRGGFSRERAGEIGDASSAILESLVDRSLLRFLPSGRYEMHELLRQYAAEKLAALPEAQTEARDRHCAHYSAFLQHWEADLIGAGAAEALTAIRVEMANVRAAWNWGATRAKLEEIARGLDGLSRYYLLAGPFREGETLIGMAVDQVRAHVGQDEEAGRDVRAVLGRLLAEQAHLLNLQGMHEEAIVAARAAIDQAEGSQAARAETAGYLQWGLALWCQGEYGAARSRLERALTLARVAQLHLLEGDSLRNLGIVCHYLEDWAGARACHEQAWRIYQAIGDRRGEGSSLVNLGLISHAHGDYAGARVCYEEALCISREIGDRRNEGIALANLGLMCNQQGDYAGARACYEEAMRISREIGNRRSESIVLSNLALLCHRQGNDGAALQYGKQALHLAQDIGDRPIQAYALMHLGHALEGLGPLSEAAEVYQQALVLRQELGQQNLAIESLAGAARVSLAQGNLTQAQAQVEEILAHLETNIRSTTHDTAASGHGLHGAVEPFRVYLTCYRVLRAGQDLRAQEILNTAHRLLQEQAARISDEELRRSFLENVAAHREIVEEVRARDNAQYRSAVF
jgi:tetratricopeptide (TPR) repeat protein